jgi:pyruvate/2-oxoglutarate dehydrogenase complex dihydrolipoamide dehydrogenase (E3) component
MSEPERFEVLILGSSFGGKLLAWHMAQSGRRTAVVERRWIGGSCPNIACLPSKNEIWGAKIAHQARHAAQFGTMITGPITTDMAKVRQRKRDMVEREIELHLHNYRTTGAELIMGSARFVAPNTLEVRLNDGGTRVLVGDQVFLNLGTHALIPAVPGLESARPLTHIEALELSTCTLTSGGARRRLCRPRTGAGLSPLRESRDGYRDWCSADGPRRSRRRR